MQEIKQAFGDVDDIVKHVASIVASGADSVDSIISVYAGYRSAVNAGMDSLHWAELDFTDVFDQAKSKIVNLSLKDSLVEKAEWLTFT